MYTNLWIKSRDAPEILSFLLLSQKSMVLEKTIHKAIRAHLVLFIKPIRDFSIVHCLPKLYFGFNQVD